MKTFIRWQGNKSKHLNKFIEYIPEITGTYIEPFVGSGALLLKLQPKKWIINDINKDLINIWNEVKNNPDEIIKIFKEFGHYFKPLSKKDKVTYCKEITSKIEYLPYNLQRATSYLLMKCCSYMDIIIKNKFFFTGLEMHIYIENNYPFLKQKHYDNILEVSQFLNKSKGYIFNMSYEKILNRSKHGDFIFLDPPYIEEHNYDFNYNKNETLNDVFILNLYQQVKKLDRKGVKWLMTQADTRQTREIFKEYHIKTFQVYRRPSKSYVNELVIMNYTV